MVYFTLAAVAFLLLAFQWRQGVHAHSLALVLLTGAAISMADLFTNALLHLYVFRPGILPQPADNFVGVLIAECLFVPSLYGLLALLPPRRRLLASGGIVLLLIGIEQLFLRLQVYELHGWQTWHTAVAFGAFGMLMGAWANRFERLGYTGPRRLTLVAATVTYLGNLWGVSILSTLQPFRLALHPILSAGHSFHVGSFVVHGIPFIVAGTAIIWFRQNRTLWQQVLPFFGFWAWMGWLTQTGVRHLRFAAEPLGAAIVYTLLIYAAGRIDRWYESVTARPELPS
ncbi:MAG: hypothetical protein ACM3XM_16710 [Mycobacterium leprae]